MVATKRVAAFQNIGRRGEGAPTVHGLRQGVGWDGSRDREHTHTHTRHTTFETAVCDMDSSDELLSSATADDIVELAAEGGSVVLEAAGMRSDGAGGLAWMASIDGPSTIVRNKFRMMCAMLNDGTRAKCYADAIDRRLGER